MYKYHIPVLLNKCIDGLNINPDGIYVDVTFGGGGHSKEILKKLDTGHLFAFDQDAAAAKNVIDDSRFTFIAHNFRFIKNFLKYYKNETVNGILADLGVSSRHLDDPERGFSFRFESELDMRMNQKAEKSAKDILNQYSHEELSAIFKNYGEIRNAWNLAKKICDFRQTKEITNSGELLELIRSMAPKRRENKFFAQVFQALRIEVNKELDVLKKFLQQTPDLLTSGGRLVVITYHSLEDRIVKNFIKSGNFEGRQEKDFYGNIIAPFKAINNKVIVPTEDEIRQNTRARSAKLRIAERI